MSSLTNINNNSSVVNVGRTSPVNPGQQVSEKSIPVVVASDQSPIPVVEQNKIQSEVALSLLGIPRSEVALGIFADVNTYDVNPSEWSAQPVEYTLDSNSDGWGIKHLPEEAGALIEAPKDKFSVLTSNRFFRYQPGRVSAATFGVKSSISPSSTTNVFDLNPSIRKYGIFDKYDGYYWETRADGTGDNFCVVRRTQSLLRNNPLSYGSGAGQQLDDHALIGKAPNVYSDPPNALPSATKLLVENRFKIIETAFAAAELADSAVLNLTATNKLKCKRDMDLAMEAYILDLQYGGNAHSIVNATTYKLALLNNTTAETTVHTELRTAIVNALTDAGETVASGRVYTSGATSELARWTLNAVVGTQPTSGEIAAANYGSRSGISTVFAIYSRFLAYVASEYSFDGTNTNIVVANSYTTSSSTLSAEEIKYRCFRDIVYILKGYSEDLQFGGNASTIYNAKRYYFNGIQVYSQSPSGITGEIKRHQFVQKLLTENGGAFNIPTVSGKSYLSLTSLFPNVFNSTLRNKLITLSNVIINNFSTEYVGDIVYGSGGNYGDLVVLRDGLIMTHAAVFDASLLKQTKNVVVKPGFIVKTTGSGTSGGNTITVASATGIVAGLSVAASVTGIPDGTTVVSISGTTITLSSNLSATIGSGSTISFGDSTLETSQEEFIVGQYINFYGTSAAASNKGLTANKLYKVEKVRGPKSNIITVSDATTKNTLKVNITGTTLTIVSNPDNVVLAAGTVLEGKGLISGTTIISGSTNTWTINSAPANNLTNVEVTKITIISPDVDPTNPTVIFINPNVPFIFPKEYFTGRADNLNTAETPFTRPDGLFPILYTKTGSLPATNDTDENKVGFIDTSIVGSNPGELKLQIDTVNLLYNNWVKQNVDPRYYNVYEFKIPRSRFSTDQLNGTLNSTVFSDVATGETGGRVYPGQTVTSKNVGVQTKSVWEIDFTKVAMLKVEFSWYGAVGALFLAYVPVGNGEARWVRVHHLRASNQLKISSLGNATLPITYFVYGGGSVSRLGITDTTNKGYTRSNHVVKYGASYYIDGGDRGTVRLYSHSTMNNVEVYGSSYLLGNLSTSTDSIGTYIDVTGVSGLPSDKKFFMKAKLLTNSKADQNVEIIWVATNKLYLNKGSLVSTNGLVAIANRPSIVFGLKAKENILNSVGTGVRNRVQVYPTKLSTSSIAPTGVNVSPKVKLQMLKTPLFQLPTTTSGSFTLTSAYDITPSNLPLTTSSTTYLARDGDGIYGWFRANIGTVFGYLYKLNGNYYFTLLETYSEQVTLLSGVAFLADGRYDYTGATLSVNAEDIVQKERLSSVFISTQIQTPIPKTGTEVSSFFLQEGSDLFDLLSYFDYNKDYLSFPLTNKIESVYLAASSVQSSTGSSVAEVSSSLTWEEQ